MAAKTMAVDELPDTTQLRCPHCGCALAAVPLYRHAVNFVDRKCRSRRCGTRWTIKCDPIGYSTKGILVVRNTFSEHPVV